MNNNIISGPWTGQVENSSGNQLSINCSSLDVPQSVFIDLKSANLGYINPKQLSFVVIYSVEKTDVNTHRVLEYSVKPVVNENISIIRNKIKKKLSSIDRKNGIIQPTYADGIADGDIRSYLYVLELLDLYG